MAAIKSWGVACLMSLRPLAAGSALHVANLGQPRSVIEIDLLVQASRAYTGAQDVHRPQCGCARSCRWRAAGGDLSAVNALWSAFGGARIRAANLRVPLVVLLQTHRRGQHFTFGYSADFLQRNTNNRRRVSRRRRAGISTAEE